MTQTPKLRAFLKNFHERYPGVTAGSARTLRDAKGRTSYEVLSDAAFYRDDISSILDLGCGDGVYLELMSSLVPSASLAGVDFVEMEVARAQSRVPGALIIVGDVTEALPFRDGEFDAVTAHLVLMLLGSLDATLQNVARVLRPNGVLAFVTDDLARTPSSYEHLMRVGMAGAGTLRDGTRMSSSADPRLYDATALRSLFADHHLNLAILERFQVRTRIGEDSAWEHMRRSYPIGLLDDDRLNRAREAIIEEMRRHATDELMVPLQLGIAVREP
jgi:SAM-dependent methyltransferase